MTRHTLIWLFLLLAIFVFAPFLVSSDRYQQEIDRELTSAITWYGPQEGEKVASRAKDLYDLLIVKSGVEDILSGHLKDQPVLEMAPGVPLPEHMRADAKQLLAYWANFISHIWLFCLRITHAMLWVTYFSPFLVAAVFDGVMTRKAKLSSFKYTSPALFNLSWHVIILVVAGSTFLMAVVLPMPAVIYPTVITIMGLMVRTLISNIQHSA